MYYNTNCLTSESLIQALSKSLKLHAAHQKEMSGMMQLQQMTVILHVKITACTYIKIEEFN
jgi:hypothetical protein